jgi:methylated-DNA-[protein]-cysteine S-methyltransferase
MSDLDCLRQQWTMLYSQTLPKLARARDPVQRKWPVTLDHCFARIILDNTIGDGRQQWDKVIQKPAIRNMNEQQLRNAIALAERVQAGDADLCYLDEMSLRCRAKNEAKYSRESAKLQSQGEPLESPGARHKRSLEKSGGPEESSTKRLKPEKRQSTLQFHPNTKAVGQEAPSSSVGYGPTGTENSDPLNQTLHRIRSHPSLTPYRKKLYTTLLSVPRGQHTTYAAMSEYLDSSARAVGNGMRNNPFAPDVPCHRVLASNGSIGGFNGEWGKDGKDAGKKLALLRGEGVRFDGLGKVVGEPFRKFHLFQDIK